MGLLKDKKKGSPNRLKTIGLAQAPIPKEGLPQAPKKNRKKNMEKKPYRKIIRHNINNHKKPAKEIRIRITRSHLKQILFKNYASNIDVLLGPYKITYYRFDNKYNKTKSILGIEFIKFSRNIKNFIFLQTFSNNLFL